MIENLYNNTNKQCAVNDCLNKNKWYIGMCNVYYIPLPIKKD